MEEIDDLKLGALLPDPRTRKKVIKFKDISRVKNSDAVQYPDSADYLASFKSWQMLGNDRYQNCVAVAWANMRRLVTSKLCGRENYPSMDQVMEFYRTQNKDLKPSLGMGVYPALEELLKNGGPDGSKVSAFASVDHTNLQEIRIALAIFGSLWISFPWHKHNREEFEYGQPFTPPKEDDEEYLGNHSAIIGGYMPDGKLKIVTWGQTALISPEYATQWIAEAYVVVWPEHLGNRRFTRGIDQDKLREQYEMLAGDEHEFPEQNKILNSILFVPEENLNSQKRWLRIKKMDSKINPNIFQLNPNPRDMLTIEIPFLEPERDDRDMRVFVYSVKPNYAVTPISIEDAQNATLVIDNGDLYFIFTGGCREYVEVQRLYGPGYYEVSSETLVRTRFKRYRSQNSVFTIDNGDLYVIKRTETISGRAEVHFYTQESNFQVGEVYEIGFDGPPPEGRYVIRGGDLYVIFEGEENLEIICLRGNKNFSTESMTSFTTGIRIDEMSETYSVGLNGNLYMIKTEDTLHGLVEVWIASSSSNYKSVQICISDVPDDESIKSESTDQTGTPSKKRWII